MNSLYWKTYSLRCVKINKLSYFFELPSSKGSITRSRSYSICRFGMTLHSIAHSLVYRQSDQFIMSAGRPLAQIFVCMGKLIFFFL